MDIVNMIAQCIGYVVMAVSGIGTISLIVYIAASEYFKFAVNRLGGFKVLKRYMLHELEFLHWLSAKQEKAKDPTR